MPAIVIPQSRSAHIINKPEKAKRIESIDLLRGVVMIIMALDHVRNYLHADALVYSPTNLEHTSAPLFFTRWITHFCAPAFIFLSGISAYLYGGKKGKQELSFFLFTRGVWLVFAELFIVTTGWSFNFTFPYFNLQVIWAIGICMIILSVLIHLGTRSVLVIGLLLIASHNLLDGVHVQGKALPFFLWSLLHEPNNIAVGDALFLIRYPVLPWIGVICVGYYSGKLYIPGYDAAKRKKILLYAGTIAIIAFIVLRLINVYGDAARWSIQKNVLFSLLSFLNVTKYPPSLLYILMTIGPALIFLAFTEGKLNGLTRRVTVFGRVPFFYYIVHIYLIHLLAIDGALILGYKWTDMILSSRISETEALKGFGFNLFTVYIIWIAVILILYPCCRWFDKYKHNNKSAKKWWLSYV